MMEKAVTKKLPKYLCLANEYRQRIVNGIYKSGDSLPDERSLSREWNFDRLTVRRAFDVLQQEGLVHKIIGSGMYVGGKSIAPVNQHLNHNNLYPIIGIAVPETLEHQVLKILENAAISNVFHHKHEALRINYVSQSELKSRLILYQHFLNGIVFFSDDYSEISSNVQYAISCGIPVVVAGLEIPSQENNVHCDSLFIDDKNSSRKIIEYFIGNGHRQIVLVGVDNNTIKKGGQYVGFINTVLEYGLKPVICNEKKLKISEFGNASTPFLEACGVKIAGQIMSKRKRPTAIMCQNDYIAMGILKQLRKMKILCPEDVEVFGFGDEIRYSAMCFFSGINPLSSAGADYNEIGKKAVDMLMNRIAHPAMDRVIENQQNVIIHRQTTGDRAVVAKKRINFK